MKFEELCEDILAEAGPDKRGRMIHAVKVAMKELGLNPKGHKFSFKGDRKNLGGDHVFLNGELVMYTAEWDTMIKRAKEKLQKDTARYGLELKESEELDEGSSNPDPNDTFNALNRVRKEMKHKTIQNALKQFGSMESLSHWNDIMASIEELDKQLAEDFEKGGI
jgi:hypothetical protein